MCVQSVMYGVDIPLMGVSFGDGALLVGVSLGGALLVGVSLGGVLLMGTSLLVLSTNRVEVGSTWMGPLLIGHSMQFTVKCTEMKQ